MTFNFESKIIFISSILIVSREISISYLRLFIVSKSKQLSEVKSDLMGKYKTAIQMSGLGLILITPITPKVIMDLKSCINQPKCINFLVLLMKYSNKWIV